MDTVGRVGLLVPKLRHVAGKPQIPRDARLPECSTLLIMVPERKKQQMSAAVHAKALGCCCDLQFL